MARVALAIGACALACTIAATARSTSSRTVSCCSNGVCEQVPAEIGCRVAPLAPVRDRASSARPLSLSDRFARALTADGFSHVVIGTIEGEEAFLDGGSIRTWCTIRVHRAYRGDVPDDGLLRVLYDGGSLDVDHESWPSHGPRCLPFDYGVFTLYEDATENDDDRGDGGDRGDRGDHGALRPTDLSTISMLASGREWPDHPLTLLLDALATRQSARW